MWDDGNRFPPEILESKWSEKYIVKMMFFLKIIFRICIQLLQLHTVFNFKDDYLIEN